MNHRGGFTEQIDLKLRRTTSDLSLNKNISENIRTFCWHQKWNRWIPPAFSSLIRRKTTTSLVPIPLSLVPTYRWFLPLVSSYLSRLQTHSTRLGYIPIGSIHNNNLDNGAAFQTTAAWRLPFVSHFKSHSQSTNSILLPFFSRNIHSVVSYARFAEGFDR